MGAAAIDPPRSNLSSRTFRLGLGRKTFDLPSTGVVAVEAADTVLIHRRMQPKMLLLLMVQNNIGWLPDQSDDTRELETAPKTTKQWDDRLLVFTE